MCESCKRTDRHIKKYARNLCQTCYKKKKNEQNPRFRGQYTSFVPSTHIPNRENMEGEGDEDEDFTDREYLD